MDNIASESLCRELYSLSRWGDEFIFWDIPAYDLGYLLEKLPREFDGYYFDLSTTTGGIWVAEYFTNDYTTERPIFLGRSKGTNPEDAVAALAIELFKQGILKGQGDV